VRRVGVGSLSGLVPGRQKPSAKQGDLTQMLDGAPEDAAPPRDRWREVRTALADFFHRQKAPPSHPGRDPRLERFWARRGSTTDLPDQGT
jgi:hypothetical protein